MAEQPQTQRYYSHGKLLLSGEYLVLDGALALALPTYPGQSLIVTLEDEHFPPGILAWKSYAADGQCWFSATFDWPAGRYREGTDRAVGERLEQLFAAGRRLNPQWWASASGQRLSVRTELEFPRAWGLGTSSTLVSNLARWWSVDPYQLLAATFGGSGYDLACATASGPIFYQLHAGRPRVEPATFSPPFARQLSFVYLEQKQNSRSGIANYRRMGAAGVQQLQAAGALSRSLVTAQTLSEFQGLLREHEQLIAGIIGIEPVQDRLFPDFPGTIKSLGAWGGDFVLAAADLDTELVRAYFSRRAYPVLIPYEQLVLPA